MRRPIGILWPRAKILVCQYFEIHIQFGFVFQSKLGNRSTARIQRANIFHVSNVRGANSDWSFIDPLNALGGKPVAIQGIVGRDDPKATMSRMRFTGRRKVRGTRWPCLALSAVRRYRRHWLPLASVGKHNSSLGRENYFASRGDKFQLTFGKFSGCACVGPRDLSDRPESQAQNSRVSSCVFLILNAASEIQNCKSRGVPSCYSAINCHPIGS